MWKVTESLYFESMVLLPKESLTLAFVLSLLVLSPDHTLLLLKRLIKILTRKIVGRYFLPL